MGINNHGDIVGSYDANHHGFLLTDNDPTIQGDLDGDGDVDRDDVSIILASRGEPAAWPDDPRDIDGDGFITVGDGRSLVLLCTRPRCALE